jgi:putative DNA primase/helicase
MATVSAHVTPIQRYRPSLACQICGGHPRLPKGQGIRCYGFVSADGCFAHCTRPEHAGRLPETNAGTFPHRLDGQCNCGQQHDLAPVAPPQTRPVLNSERIDAARRIWMRTQPAARTIVQAYLRSRGLNLPIPPTLRFALLHHGPTGRQLPAMVAAAQRWPSAEPVAVHRTYLAFDGSRKADVPEPRLSYGPIKDAAVRLAPPGETLLIGEGIETALSGQQETSIPAWATVSASNMLNVALPELPLASLVIIAADADKAGLEAARRTAETLVRQGRRVRIAYPPAGQDLNDLLRGGS